MAAENYYIGIDLTVEDFRRYAPECLKKEGVIVYSVEATEFKGSRTVCVSLEHDFDTSGRLNAALVIAQRDKDDVDDFPLPRMFSMEGVGNYHGIFEMC